MITPRLTPLAKADLKNRADYLESRRRGYAQRFLSAFERTSYRIVRAPTAIARFNAVHPKLSEMRITPVDGFPNLLIVFHIVDSTVVILRVLHGAQNIEAMSDEILPD